MGVYLNGSSPRHREHWIFTTTVTEHTKSWQIKRVFIDDMFLWDQITCTVSTSGHHTNSSVQLKSDFATNHDYFKTKCHSTCIHVFIHDTDNNELIYCKEQTLGCVKMHSLLLSHLFSQHLLAIFNALLYSHNATASPDSSVFLGVGILPRFLKLSFEHLWFKEAINFEFNESGLTMSCSSFVHSLLDSKEFRHLFH